MRAPGQIRRELDALAARRSMLWRQLAARYDPRASSEIARLNARMSRLWRELRDTRSRIVFGPTEAIRARARMDIALERELETRRAGGRRPAFEARTSRETRAASDEGA
jgi:hypothetical protein